MGAVSTRNSGTGSWGKMEKCGFLAQKAQWDMRGFQSWAQRRVMNWGQGGWAGCQVCTLKSSLKEEGRWKQGQATNPQGTEDEQKIKWETKKWRKTGDERRGILSHFRRLKTAKRGERKGQQSSRKLQATGLASKSLRRSLKQPWAASQTNLRKPGGSRGSGEPGRHRGGQGGMKGTGKQHKSVQRHNWLAPENWPWMGSGEQSANSPGAREALRAQGQQRCWAEGRLYKQDKKSILLLLLPLQQWSLPAAFQRRN